MGSFDFDLGRYSPRVFIKRVAIGYLQYTTSYTYVEAHL